MIISHNKAKEAKIACMVLVWLRVLPWEDKKHSNNTKVQKNAQVQLTTFKI